MVDLDSKWVFERFDTAWLEWTRCTRKSSLGGVNGRERPGKVSRRKARVDSPLRPASRPSPPWKFHQSNQSISLLNYSHTKLNCIEHRTHTQLFNIIRFFFSLLIVGSIDWRFFIFTIYPTTLRALCLLYDDLVDPPPHPIYIHPLLSSRGGCQPIQFSIRIFRLDVG